MRIYKNPFVPRESYFVKTGTATGRGTAASKGYIVEFWDGKWEVKEGVYCDFSLKNEMPVIAENRKSIKSVIEMAILNAVLDLVGGAKMGGKENE